MSDVILTFLQQCVQYQGIAMEMRDTLAYNTNSHLAEKARNTR